MIVCDKTPSEDEHDPATYRPAQFPVLVKAVIVQDGKVVLLRNERDEWELAGGKLEPGEHPPEVTTSEPPVVSHEHTQAGLFAEHEVPGLAMPGGYKRSIAAWYARLRQPAEQAAGQL